MRLFGRISPAIGTQANITDWRPRLPGSEIFTTGHPRVPAMTDEPYPRELVAALSLLTPGLGHVFLGAWRRVCLWLPVGVATTVFVLPGWGFHAGVLSVLPAGVSELEVVAVLAAVALAFRLVATVDTVVALANRSAHVCSECTRETLDGVGFCHWCLEDRE